MVECTNVNCFSLLSKTAYYVKREVLHSQTFIYEFHVYNEYSFSLERMLEHRTHYYTFPPDQTPYRHVMTFVSMVLGRNRFCWKKNPKTLEK